jgi:CheY-like chemotaxis protein
VRGHHGALKVESQLGQGTTFSILLPYVAGAVDPGAGRLQTLTLWHGSGTVLVIDDEAHVRGVVTRMLERVGLNVLCAANGEAGIDLCRVYAAQIAVVLLDLTLPQMNGVDTFEALRRIKPNVPIVVMSGYNEQELSGHFADLQALSFLHKPFTPSELYDNLRQVLAVS